MSVCIVDDYTFSDRIKVGIYKDFEIDFTDISFKD